MSNFLNEIGLEHFLEKLRDEIPSTTNLILSQKSQNFQPLFYGNYSRTICSRVYNGTIRIPDAMWGKPICLLIFDYRSDAPYIYVYKIINDVVEYFETGDLDVPFQIIVNSNTKNLTWYADYSGNQRIFFSLFPAREVEGTCILQGAKVLTKDGEKNIEDLKAGDQLAFWNSAKDRKKIEYNKLILPPQEVEAKQYSNYIFSDGSVLPLVGVHMLWDADKEHLVRNVDAQIGDHFYNANGEKVTLESVEVVTPEQPLKSYNLFVRHRRYFANNIMCGHTNGALYIEYIKPENEQYRYKDADGSYLRFLEKEYEKTCAYRYPFGNPIVFEAIKPLWLQIGSLKHQEQEARKNLEESDYIVTKYNEGLLTEEEFQTWKVRREQWREIIRNNETEIPALQKQMKDLAELTIRSL